MIRLTAFEYPFYGTAAFFSGLCVGWLVFA